MNLEPAPRLPKWIFFAIDAGLLIAAFVIIYFNGKNPYAPLPFVSAVICVALAGIIGLIPFLIDYAADSAEYVQQERVRANEQVQRLHAAGESLARAAAQIKAVEEAVHKTAHAAENLPYRMQEKLAEFNAALAEEEESDRAALEEELVELRATNSEQLKAVADKIHQAAADWTALEAATRQQLTVAGAAVTKVQNAANDTAAKFEARLAAALATLDAKLGRLETPGTPTQTSAPQQARTPEAAPTPAAKPHAVTEPPPLVESVAVIGAGHPAGIAATPTEDPKTKRPRVPRKPKPEDTLAAMSEPTFPHGEEDVNSGGFARTDAPEIFHPEPVEAAASSDGATRLLATAYIGIGNKLFIRGEGPGLRRDKGVPMHFVSIGKWGWATNDATTPVHCELYKNDETAALTGEIVLYPGKHVEITALF
jgi:hypothetical protein